MGRIVFASVVWVRGVLGVTFAQMQVVCLHVRLLSLTGSPFPFYTVKCYLSVFTNLFLRTVTLHAYTSDIFLGHPALSSACPNKLLAPVPAPFSCILRSLLQAPPLFPSLWLKLCHDQALPLCLL